MTLASRTLGERLAGFFRHKAAVAGAVVLFVFVALALLAPVLPIASPEAMDYMPYQPPSKEHWMGTDNFGRDVFARVVWGARLALQVAIVSAGLSTLLGVILGSLAGYYGGWLDSFLSRTFDIFLLIPTFFLVILVVALFGSGIYLIMIAIAVSTWPRSARIVRAEVLSVKSRAFVQATLAAGANHLQALVNHVIPNSLAPAITNATILMGLAILTEAGLSFLGLGDPNSVSWGRMIFDAQRQLRLAPWLAIFPGMAMFLLVAALNFIGDGVTGALTPAGAGRGRRVPGLPGFGGERSSRQGGTQEASPADGAQVLEEGGDAAPRTMLEIEDLRVYYRLEKDWLRAVDGVTLRVPKGGSLGIVGESGSGKSTMGLALMGILPTNARVVSGRVTFDGKEIVAPGKSDYTGNRWTRLSMVFQSAMNALNPVMTVGRQLSDAYRLYKPRASESEVKGRIEELFDLVGIPISRIDSYPHELSGGMRQRVMIVFALLLGPDLVIADEPTTALDVLVQDQILAEIDELRRIMNLSLILVSHDIATVAETCDRIAVMYAGQIVEQGPTKDVLERPRHPYTSAMISALPTLTGPRRTLEALPGEPFAAIGETVGCRFAPRCRFATDLCRTTAPTESVGPGGRSSLCHYPEAVEEASLTARVPA